MIRHVLVIGLVLVMAYQNEAGVPDDAFVNNRQDGELFPKIQQESGSVENKSRNQFDTFMTLVYEVLKLLKAHLPKLMSSMISHVFRLFRWFTSQSRAPNTEGLLEKTTQIAENSTDVEAPQIGVLARVYYFLFDMATRWNGYDVIKEQQKKSQEELDIKKHKGEFLIRFVRTLLNQTLNATARTPRVSALNEFIVFVNTTDIRVFKHSVRSLMREYGSYKAERERNKRFEACQESRRKGVKRTRSLLEVLLRNLLLEVLPGVRVCLRSQSLEALLFKRTFYVRAKFPILGFSFLETLFRYLTLEASLGVWLVLAALLVVFPIFSIY
jgi:hypothetical protein